MTVNDVDIAVDTQSNLPEAGLPGTKKSQYHYRSHLKKQMARYQTIFTPSETTQETAQEFFVSSERQQGLETQTEETIVHAVMRGHSTVQLPPRMAFHMLPWSASWRQEGY